MATGAWQAHIPGTTVGRPAISGKVVARPAVTAELARARGGLVVVTAPAGYGKTTAVALWEDLSDDPFAWVRLDTLDNDPTHLLLHLATAMAQVVEVDRTLLHYLRGAGRDARTQLVPAVIRALEGCGPIVLVLDDVHELTVPASVDALRALVALAPVSATLVLISRSTPPVDLARRRLQGSVVDIGIPELTLTADEGTAAFTAIGGGADAATVSAVLDKCEGWPAGVAMAALAYRDGARIATFTGRHRLVAGYLVEEVLNRLTPATVTFLMESAVLERFCAEQLNELLGREDSASMLDAVTQSGNLFLISLDSQGIWYRYHRLFGDLLRERLRDRDPARFRLLAGRAADLLERYGDIDGALPQALVAEDPAHAAALVGRDAARLGFDGRAGILARRLSLLTEQIFTDYPDAAIARAWLGVATGDAELIQRSLLMAGNAADGRPLADGTVSVDVAAALIGSLVGVGGVQEVIRHAETVCAAGDHLTNPWWGAATTMLGAALSMLGDVDGSRAKLEAALPVLDDLPGFQAAAHAHLALSDLDDGNLDTAVEHGAAARAIVDSCDLGDLVPMTVVFAVDGLVRARRGDVAGAKSAVRETERLMGRLGDLSARTVLLGHVLVAATGGEIDDTALCERHLQAATRARRREPDALGIVQRLDEVRAVSAARAARGVRPSLTTAELRLLPYLASHLSLQRIADELSIGRETVKSQTKSIYRKLAVPSRAAAVAEARRVGLLNVSRTR